MLEPHTILQNRYRIVRPLGRGGMGAVYEALDQRLSRAVAIKETLVETEQLRRAFEREAQLLANLRHPSLPNVIDHFAEGAGLFLVMEYIPGDDLAALLAQRGDRPFATVEVLAWADQLLGALEYLHTHEPPIIHRDVKPSNLKLTARGQVILLDFGLAKGATGQMSTLTAARSVLGYTPNYAPLEQIEGAGTDPQSDLYALGATLYHLLTGVRPPEALKRATALLHNQPDPLQPAHEINPAVPLNVSAALRRALAVRADQRPASAAEMRRELHGALAPDAESTFTAGRSSDDEITVVAPAPDQVTVAPGLPLSRRQVIVPLAPESGREAARPGPSARRRWWVAVPLLAALFGAVVIAWYALGPARRGAARPTPVPANANRSAPQPSPTPFTPTPVPTETDEMMSARGELEKRGIPYNHGSFLQAAERGDLNTARLFLDAGMDPNARGTAGRTALLLASARGRDHLAKIFLERGADVNAADDGGSTPLIEAAGGGHEDTLRALLDRGADVNRADAEGQTALLRAAKEGHAEIVRLLINRGARVEVKDTTGRTPLRWAVINERREVAELLRRAGATR